MPFLHFNDMDMLKSEVVPRNPILMSLSLQLLIQTLEVSPGYCHFSQTFQSI